MYCPRLFVPLQTMEKIILGIDPGTNLMGYGVIKVTDGKAEMITMGVIDLRKFADGYLKLGHIFERVTDGIMVPTRQEKTCQKA